MVQSRLDREFQLQILQKLLSVFPHLHDFSADVKFNQDQLRLTANLYYLQQHGLISPNTVRLSKTMGRNTIIDTTEITHKGIDFMLDDGGLSAILNIMTVKLEAEQFKELLQHHIQQSDMSDEAKQGYLDRLKDLPSEAIKHIMTKLIDMGMDSLSTIMPN